MHKSLQQWTRLGILASILLMSVLPIRAGSIALTGHDDDYHCNFGPNSIDACSQLQAMINFAKGGSALPVLTFDAGSELTGALTSLGISYTNVNPDTAAITNTLFNHSIYSAFVVASDSSCGGCDNDPVGEANIAARNTAIDSFLNSGGGIVGLAGAGSGNYYQFVPQTASSVGGAPSDGYSQTAAGATYKINAVNGDQTHNLFWNPGTHSESGFYQVVESNSFGNGTILGPNAATTLVCYECTTTGGVITGGGGTSPVPEPSNIAFLAAGISLYGICKVAGLLNTSYTKGQERIS